MATADKRSRAGEVLPVFQLFNILMPIDGLNGDVFVSSAYEKFIELGSLEQCFGSGMPLLVGVFREFG